MKEIAKYSTFVLILSFLLLGCTPPEGPAESNTAVEESEENEASEPALQLITPQAPSELTILAEPTATPEEYPAPTATAVGESYPRSTPVPFDPYVEPEESGATDGSTAVAEASNSDELSLADANVTFVRAVSDGDNSWTFHVTVEHPDTGNSDYADGWDIITPENEVLKADPNDSFTRLLAHPHVNEQPFTRSQSGITIPDGVNGVFVRAHDLVHGWGGEMVFVDFTQESGQNFVIEQ